jgi:hypothetical protein
MSEDLKSPTYVRKKRNKNERSIFVNIFYPSVFRLCQGSKGPCIWFQDAWLTPNEFQYLSGRETAKDWKRSIRHCGKSMKLLLTKGILTTHPPICDCEGCRITSPVVRPIL